jgi:hypothetical protein
VSLAVTCDDTPAFRLYARAGFVAVGVPEPLREGSPMQAVTMRLSLLERAARPERSSRRGIGGW